MEQSRSSKVLWTIWMALGGVLVALAVYWLTESIAWTIVGLLGSGVVLNAIAQIVVQPIKAARRATRGPGRLQG